MVIFIWLGLSLYWIAPIIIVSGNHILEFDPLYTSMHILSVYLNVYFWCFSSFCIRYAKVYLLEIKSGNLITTEMFSKLEMLIILVSF